MSELHTQYPAFVAKLFNRTGDLSKDFAHAILGLVTETHELRFAVDEVNAIEEGGDLTFYRVAARQVLEDAAKASGQVLSLEGDAYANLLNEVLAKIDEDKYVADATINLMLNDLMDDAKRWVGYGKAPKDFSEVYGRVKVVGALVMGLNIPDGVTSDRVVKANMAKLLKRYPGGEFDSFRAVTRDLGAERDALEAN